MGTRGDPGVTPGTCGAGGEKAQVILVWVRAPSVGNASHPRRLGVIRIFFPNISVCDDVSPLKLRGVVAHLFISDAQNIMGTRRTTE